MTTEEIFKELKKRYLQGKFQKEIMGMAAIDYRLLTVFKDEEDGQTDENFLLQVRVHNDENNRETIKFQVIGAEGQRPITDTDEDLRLVADTIKSLADDWKSISPNSKPLWYWLGD